MTDLEGLAEEWLEERRTGGATHVWHRVQLLAARQPEQAWALFAILLRKAAAGPGSRLPDGALRVHVASILGLIIERHLVAFIERIEAAAAAEPLFRELLAHVSVPSDAAPPEAMRRLRTASEGRVTIYPGPGTDLARVAYDVAERFRSGRLPGVPRGTRYPVPLLAKEIERLAPGHTREEYSVAASRALQWSR